MRVLLGMSGGVDSAYSAERLRREGHEVEGAVLVMHGHTELDAARAASRELGMQLHEIDVSELFERTVVADFICEYRHGRTPNPCILCNSAVKFAALFSYATENGFDRIATGHYARILEQDGRYSVLRGLDPKKDQSYFLWRLEQGVLEKLMLPLGDLVKEEVKNDADRIGLSSAKRGESRDICFVPDGDYAAFLERRCGSFPEGEFVSEDGRVLGVHRGIHRYTVGQRRGLGVALGERMYVKAIDPERSRVVLAPAGDASVTEFLLRDPVFSGAKPLQNGECLRAEVSLRYQARTAPARLFCEDGVLRVLLDEPRHAVTAGQSAVFYDGDRVLLGGIIG